MLCVTSYSLLSYQLNHSALMRKYRDFHFHGFHNRNYLPLYDLLPILYFPSANHAIDWCK